MYNFVGEKLKKEQTIDRICQIKIKNRKRENNFNIEIGKKQIFQLQNGNNARNILTEDLKEKKIFIYDR